MMGFDNLKTKQKKSFWLNIKASNNNDYEDDYHININDDRTMFNRPPF